MTSRTEIAAIVARLRCHARRASIEKGYTPLDGGLTRNQLAEYLRETARLAENTSTISIAARNVLEALDEVNPWKKSRGKLS